MLFTKKYKKLLKRNNQLLNLLTQTVHLQDEKNEDYVEVDKQYFKVVPHWFWNEYKQSGWEPQTYNIYQKYMTNNTTYVDVGAWVGMTVFYAAQVGVKDIYAIEANPVSYDMVCRNCGQNYLTQNAKVDHICITDKDNDKIDFGSTNGTTTSSSSSIRGNDWKVSTTTLITYLKNNKILNVDDLFIKIDIEGAEELILKDLSELSKKKNMTLFLSLHPPFMKNKEKTCKDLLKVCSEYRYVFDSTLNPLSKDELKNMVLSDEEKPIWGTKFGNFFEITLSNKDIKC